MSLIAVLPYPNVTNYKQAFRLATSTLRHAKSVEAHRHLNVDVLVQNTFHLAQAINGITRFKDEIRSNADVMKFNSLRKRILDKVEDNFEALMAWPKDDESLLPLSGHIARIKLFIEAQK